MESEKCHRPAGIAWFSWIIGALFLTYGTLSFFMSAPVDLRLKPFHASLHVLLGLAGLFLPQHRRLFVGSMTTIALSCSILGFAGVSCIPGLITLTVPLNYGYAVVGIIGLLVIVSLPPKTIQNKPKIILQ